MRSYFVRVGARQFLAELGLEEENAGVYNGSWGGSGALLTSHSPATGRPIARVRQATIEEYESCLAAMTAAQETWQLVRKRHLNPKLATAAFNVPARVMPVSAPPPAPPSRRCLRPSVVRSCARSETPCAPSARRWVTLSH